MYHDITLNVQIHFVTKFTDLFVSVNYVNRVAVTYNTLIRVDI
jgi:hypothetical protein